MTVSEAVENARPILAKSLFLVVFLLLFFDYQVVGY
jgi:hypothetical protein